MTQDVDAILIGAGHNSLACACHLAARGWKVAVYEQNSEPGGAVKTGEYTLPGFRHDWAAMNLSLFAGSAFHGENAAELAKHGLAFAPTGNPFASVFPDGRWLGISNDAAITTARVRGFSDADANAWAALTAAFPSEAEAIFGLLGSPMNLRAFSSLGWKMWRKRGGGGTLDLVRFLMMSPRAWLDQTFESDHVKATLAAWGMHLDFAPDIAGGAVFPYLEAMAGQAFGMVLGHGGADTMTRAMVKMIEARGGTVHCGQEVTAIEHASGRAIGITLADGRALRAEKAVIANVAPSALLKLTGHGGDAGHGRRVKRIGGGPGGLPTVRADNGVRVVDCHLPAAVDQAQFAVEAGGASVAPDAGGHHVSAVRAAPVMQDPAALLHPAGLRRDLDVVTANPRRFRGLVAVSDGDRDRQCTHGAEYRHRHPESSLDCSHVISLPFKTTLLFYHGCVSRRLFFLTRDFPEPPRLAIRSPRPRQDGDRPAEPDTTCDRKSTRTFTEQCRRIPSTRLLNTCATRSSMR